MADKNIPYVREAFASLGSVRTVSGGEMSAEVVADADLLLTRSTITVDEQLLGRSRARFVDTATAGVEHVDQEYLARRGIEFASAPGSNANSVAEYVAEALLVLAERGGWSVAGKTIGVVGVGNVGSRIVQKARALGVSVLENDPPLARRTGESRFVDIREIVKADVVTLHVPLTREGRDATYHMVDAAFLGEMKPGAVLINAARGPVVVEEDLKRAIKSGRLAAVVLDVWDNEPEVSTELLEMVDIGTPHIAGHSLDGKVAGTAMVYEAACRFLGVEPTVDVRMFLPPPEVPEIIVDGGGDPEAIVRATATQVYNVLDDDARLREISAVPPAERGEFFASLRRNYPVRREFYNTALSFRDCPQQARTALLRLGFRDADEEN